MNSTRDAGKILEYIDRVSRPTFENRKLSLLIDRTI